MSRKKRLVAAANLAYVRRHWPAECSNTALSKLKELTTTFPVSVARGEICLINGSWYITNAGLLRIAQKRRCIGIRSRVLSQLCDPTCGRWVFKATVFKSGSSVGFTGYGDADPTNVSPHIRGAEMRIAETRAVNRALRKAYGIGLCSIEELGWEPKPYPDQERKKPAPEPNANLHRNRNVSLRDRLCLLIRQHQLDANLVKAYALEFCGTPNLRQASREQIESLIANLSDWATKDRAALLCKLNSYSTRQEVTS